MSSLLYLPHVCNYPEMANVLHQLPLFMHSTDGKAPTFLAVEKMIILGFAFVHFMDSVRRTKRKFSVALCAVQKC